MDTRFDNTPIRGIARNADQYIVHRAISLDQGTTTITLVVIG